MGPIRSNLDDCEIGNLDVIVVLSNDEEARGGGREPRIVDGHSLAAVAQRQSEPGQGFRDSAINGK